MLSANRWRVLLTVAFTTHFGLIILVTFFDQFMMMGFSGVVGLVEIALIVIPFFLSFQFYEPSRAPLKNILVFWACISIILTGLCIYEGAALGFGVYRALWSYVYIIPACLSLFYA